MQYQPGRGSGQGSTRRRRVNLQLEMLEDRVVLSAALGVANDFNVFVLGNSNQSGTDITGREAVGGNATLNGVGFGSALPMSQTRADLLVAGHLNYQGGQLFSGNLVYGTGGPIISSVGLLNGTFPQDDPVTTGNLFNGAAAALDSLSSTYAALPANGQTMYNYGGFTLVGSQPGLNVFNVPGWLLSGANSLTVNIPTGATAIVNIDGTADQMHNFGFNLNTTLNDTNQGQVIYNFWQANTLDIKDISVEGSILAPQAAVTFNDGQQDGTLVAGSLTGNGQFHTFPSTVSVNGLTPSISGYVYLDANNDGVKQTATITGFQELTEPGIPNVSIGLFNGANLVASTTTDSFGYYAFSNLPVDINNDPETYTIEKTSPSGYYDGQDTLGNLGGAYFAQNKMQVTVGPNDIATNYNFGELPTTRNVTPGQTAGISYWTSAPGQALINSFNGGPNSTALATWLSSTFPNLYGPGSVNNLTGATNQQVALFVSLDLSSAPDAVAQVFSAALSVYATTYRLGGSSAVGDNFVVTTAGLGQSTWNVGVNGLAFNIANSTPVTVLQLLKAADSFSTNGVLESGNSNNQTMLNYMVDTVMNGLISNGSIPGHNPGIIAVGADAGSMPIVNIYSAANGTYLRTLNLTDYGSFTGGIRVAVGDVDGNGQDDVITVAGPGGIPLVEVFNGQTGQMIQKFVALPGPSFTGGSYVAVGDVLGNGFDDIIVSAGPGGGPFIGIYNGPDDSLIRDFFAYDVGFTGGVRVAAGDVSGTGTDALICTPGPGGGSFVSVYNGPDGAPINTFALYGGTFTGGLFVASADVDGDGHGDVITGTGASGVPNVIVFSGATINSPTPTQLNSFVPTGYGSDLNSPYQSGEVRVAAIYFNGDSTADILTGPGLYTGSGTPSKGIDVFNGLNPTPNQLDSFYAFPSAFGGGEYVAASPR